MAANGRNAGRVGAAWRTGRGAVGSERTPRFSTICALAQTAPVFGGAPPREPGIANEGTREFDAVAVGQRRAGVGAPAEDRTGEVSGRLGDSCEQPRALDGIGDAGAFVQHDGDPSLESGAHVGDLDPHRGTAGAREGSASARLTKASTNVLAMWLNTGPTTRSSTWVVNS